MEDNYFSLPYVSSTSLHWFENHPSYFKKMIDNELEESKKRYQYIGDQIHMFFLEKEAFNNKYVFLDYTSPSTEQQKIFCHSYIESDNLIEAYKKAYSVKNKSEKKIIEEATKLKDKFNDYIENIKISSQDKLVLTSSMNSLLSALDNSIQNHQLANKLLNNNTLEAYNEKALFFKPKDFNIQCKSKIDRYIIDKENKVIKLVDLKTTANIYEFEESIFKFNYKRQLAFYWLALINYYLEEKTNITDYTFETYIIALNKDIAMPIVKVIKFRETDILSYLDEIQDLFRQIEWHYENDKWEQTKYHYEHNGIDLEL